ncbi:Exocyst complex component [Paragonimus heterotremus]|uniref:Exocyst complex component n=1 Tax=Paragonimus heterotremus TaxID=100268 RepID=A0A8J4WYY9_9TREM|nr:Exocyst complex component [Paragonimus heterotremus]
MGDPSVFSLDFKLLLGEIESGSSGSVANVIRKLRESELAAYKAGVGGPTGELVAAFISALDAQANERNLEIERTCAHHYQGLVEATRDLLSIQNDAATMQNNIGALNKRLETAIGQYTDSCRELSVCKATLEHVDQCIEALELTLPILEQYSRIERSIAEGRFYHALRTLEDLEHSQLSRVRPYAFSETIGNIIPKLRSEIKNASLAELTDFLEHIRKHSTRLGAIAMHQVAEATGMDGETLVSPVDASKENSNPDEMSRSETPSKTSSSPLKGPAEENNDKDTKLAGLDQELEELNMLAFDRVGKENSVEMPNWNQTHIQTEDLVDFGPVYRCLHIHTVLNELTEFERYYCAQRRKQCQLSLSLSPNQQATMRSYGEFFGTICGFFVVDDYLRHTLPGSSASYQNYLDELWANAVERLVEFARTNAGSCESADDLIRLKDYAVLFNRTMTSLGFPTAGLSEMIAWIQRRYQRLLASQWRDRFETIIKNDDFSPIQISGPQQLSELSSLYPECITAEFEALPYPRQLCFSWMVPRIYSAVREYIDLCGRFCAHVDLACSELEDTVNRATNALFTDGLNVILYSWVRQSERMLPRLIQFCTNLEEIETVCGHLDSYLHRLVPFISTDEIGEVCARNSTLDKNPTSDQDPISPLNTSANPPRSRLHGASLLRDIRALVESLIYGHLNDCVDEFISLINYNNVGVDGTDGAVSAGLDGFDPEKLKPNEHIVDLTSWLSTTFRAFANIPPKVAQTACIAVCKRIASALYDLLLSPQSCELTDLCVLQLSADLNQCESFVRSQPVPGVDGNMLWLIFADLRQLLDLFRKDDWAVFITSHKKPGNNPYDRVSPSVAIKLLERVRDSEKKRTGFIMGMRKEERGRRKRIDDVIRKLRELNVVSRH